MNYQAAAAALAMLPGGVVTVIAVVAVASLLGGLTFMFAVIASGDRL